MMWLPLEPFSFVIVITFIFGVGFLVPLVPAQRKKKNRDQRQQTNNQVTIDRQSDEERSQNNDDPLTRVIKFVSSIRSYESSDGKNDSLPLAVRISLFLAIVGSLVSVGEGVWFLQTSPQTKNILISWWLPELLPSLQWEIRLDSLAAFFVLLIATFSVVVAIFSFGALKPRHYREQGPQIASAFNLFVWTTLMVVLVNDVFSLLVALELMTLVFGYLALFKHNLYLGSAHNLALYDEKQQQEKKKEARLAPQVYLMVSHTSTAFLLLALLLLAVHAHTSGFDNGLSFDTLRNTARTLSPTLATAVFLLALAGLGIRVGLTPAHFWVSLVHPASPTTTHALSLGIAIKVAVYLMFRFFFEFLDPQAWWGYTVLLMAVITALINVWYAIASHDLKTALAYHSIENIGIITVGIGVALIYASQRTEIAHWITALALIASLYHLLNHAVFKGLLYLCTGAIDNLTNQIVEFDKLGGLMKIFPWTSVAFLIGAVSISGFPPFNGFVSEWLTLQALLRGLATLKLDPSLGLVVIIVSLALLAASFALTVFCFFKMAGLTLLGVSRSDQEQRQRWAKQDVPWSMRGVIILMALLCLVLGLFPAPVMTVLFAVVKPIIAYDEAMLTAPSLTELQLSAPALTLTSAAPEPDRLMIVFGLAVAVALASGAIVLPWFFKRRREIRRPKIPWNCGTPYLPTTMQYTSGALSFLLRDRFDAVPESVTKNMQDYLPAHLELSHGQQPQAVIEIFRVVYNRVSTFLLNSALRIGSVIQNGDLRCYLLYIFVANVVALLLFFIFRD